MTGHAFRFLRQQCFIDGGWTDADSGAVSEIVNPATGAVLGRVPEMGAAETRRAIEAANRAWPGWAALTAKERGQLLRRLFDLVVENADELARLLTAEQGKPLAEARGEILYGATFLEWFAEEARRVYGDTIPAPQTDKQIVVAKQAIGVVGAITPWNFPMAMIARKCAPALAAGCPVVIKPAPATPFSALALAALAEEAGFPPGVFNVVTGPAEEIGGEMTSSPLVRKLTFTGSTAVGKLLMRQCAGTLKKLSLELGGNAPFIVFDDADLDAALDGAMVSKFRNCGQTCVTANRIYVQDGIFDVFAEKLAARVGALRVADGFAEGAQAGPMIDMRAVEKVESHIEDATRKGARVVVGGKRHALGGTFFEPTVLADVPSEARLAREETFGPVAPLFRFHTEDEVVELANATQYGLAAYFYSRDVGRAWRLAERLEYGMVGVNTGLVSTVEAPFGGVKESGIGREGSKYGIGEFLEIKYLCFGGIE